MRGKYRIIIENRKMKYDFEIKRNLTIIKGDSATGKTTLVDMVAEFYENGQDSGIYLQCDKLCAVLQGKDWKLRLGSIHDSIVFIDEGNSFVATKEFAAEIKKTNNYYVIVTREALPMLPYSVTEIYGIRNSGKYGELKQTYNEMYRIYGHVNPNEIVCPEAVITEDSGAGFEFFQYICDENSIDCVSAAGKSNIFVKVQKCKYRESVLIIADGAAFGPEMEKIVSLIHIQRNLNLYLPESFEWLILKSGIVKDRNIEEILTGTSDFVESSRYISWEQYFNALLVEKTRGTYLAYAKNTINPAYLGDKIKKEILKQMERIAFKKLEKSDVITE